MICEIAPKNLLNLFGVIDDFLNFTASLESAWGEDTASIDLFIMKNEVRHRFYGYQLGFAGNRRDRHVDLGDHPWLY